MEVKRGTLRLLGAAKLQSGPGADKTRYATLCCRPSLMNIVRFHESTLAGSDSGYEIFESLKHKYGNAFGHYIFALVKSTVVIV